MNKKELAVRMRQDCIPTIFSMCMTGFYSIMDGLFVGRAAGDTGLAAINIAWPIPALITAVGVGIGAGGSVLYSTYLGQGKTGEARYTKDLTIKMLFGSGVILTLLLLLLYSDILTLLGAKDEVYEMAKSYAGIIVLGACFQIAGAGLVPLLRNQQMSVQAMGAMSSGMVLNGCLNYIFMFPLKLGIAGAAMGTVAAQAWVILLSFWMMTKKKERDEAAKIVVHREMKKILQIGVSAMGLSLAPSVVLIFTNYQCLHWGGKEAVACYAVISYIVFPLQAMLTGLGDGTQPLISYLKGKEMISEMEWVIRLGKKIEILLGVFFLFLSCAIIPLIPGLFQMSAKATEYFKVGMYISGAAFLFMGVVKFNISYLNAIMEIKKTTCLIYGEVLLVSPALIFILPLFLGLNGIWLSLLVTQMCMLFIYHLLTRG